MDLRQIDLNLLVSLDALLAECNVTRAARRLHISQPALSAQLARLRQFFNDPLLLPAETGRGMTPTARALALGPALHLALKDLESVVLHQPSFDPATDARTFQLAVNDTAMVVIGLPLIEELAAHAWPGVRLTFRVPEIDVIARHNESPAADPRALCDGPAQGPPAGQRAPRPGRLLRAPARVGDRSRRQHARLRG